MASTVHFENYLRLLKGFHSAVTGMLVFDRDDGFVWQDSSNSVELERVQPQLKNFRHHDHDGELRQVNDDLSLEIYNLKNAAEELVLTLCLSIDASDPSLPVAALEQIDEHAFDVIVCDLMMPELTGMQLYEAVRERDKALAARMVFITGGTYTKASQQFVEETGVDCLTKPFRARDVRRLVAAAARR